MFFHGNVKGAYALGVPSVQYDSTPSFSFSVISNQGLQLHLGELFHVSSWFRFFCSSLYNSVHIPTCGALEQGFCI